ncbi:MAG: AMP-binding protein, partial [Oscillospiraceae bacterium]|nr:AMP-binding protein [Oscillospiraceae bacterium]
GEPKGVCVSHGALSCFIESFTGTLGIGPEDVMANQAPLDFDVSVKDIYSALKVGAKVCLMPRSSFLIPSRAVGILTDSRVTTLIWAVSALCVLANTKALSPAAPASIKKVMFSGEVMPIRQLNYWKSLLPDAMFVNLYGPTEVTCNCMYYVLDRHFSDAETLPLGKAFPHAGVSVLKEGGVPARAGEVGEIHVRGPSLALGYYRNPAQTAASFVQNPLNDRYPETVYKTGDLARVLPNGDLAFASRTDSQIKHLGHRVELPEIEAAVGSLEGIAAAACLYDAPKGRIVLVYEGEGVGGSDILRGIRPILPKPMHPQAFVRVAAMPYTRNGKIDRARLKSEHLDGEG